MTQALVVILGHEVTKKNGNHYLGWWNRMVEICVPEDII